MAGRPDRVVKAGRAAWLFFFLSLLVYQANLRPVAPSDSIPAALLPFAVVLDGSLALDRFGPWLNQALPASQVFLHRKDGHYYSWYPVGQPLLLVPAYAPLVRAAGAGSLSIPELVLFARVLEKLFAATLAAATVAAFFVLARRLTRSGVAWMAGAAFAFATPVWSIHSQALWQHTGGGLLIVLALLGFARWSGSPDRVRLLALAGLCSGLALAVRPTNAIFAAAMAAVLLIRRRGWRAIAAYLAPPAVCGLMTAALNLHLFGDLRGGYALPLNPRWGEGVAGLLFSPGRGLFVYCPFLLLAVPGYFVWRRREEPYRSLAAVGALFCGGHLLVAAVSPAWWGGTCWGPRLMSETVPFLVLFTIPAMERLAGSSAGLKGAFATLLAWSIFLQAVGAFCYPRGYWDDVPRSSRSAPERMWDWRDNPVRRTLGGGLVWEPYVVAAEALLHGKAAALEKMKQFGMRGF